MAATRQATWCRVTKAARTHIHTPSHKHTHMQTLSHKRTDTHTHSISHSHFLCLMNSHELFITHLHTCTAHTQLPLATEGSETSFCFIIISPGIFLGSKGIPGGARPIKLPTPPPFPPLCTLSRVLVISQHVFFLYFSLHASYISAACQPTQDRQNKAKQKEEAQKAALEQLCRQFTREKSQCFTSF